MIETCLICVVAWDVDHEPAKCNDPRHPHALNQISEWNRPGAGVIDAFARVCDACDEERCDQCAGTVNIPNDTRLYICECGHRNVPCPT